MRYVFMKLTLLSLVIVAGVNCAFGAPRGVTFSAADEGYWFYQPIDGGAEGAALVGAVEAGQNPIDVFIGKRLGEVGIEPAGRADRRTLIRRATLDLHGLPPTAGEVEAFVNDSSADAYEKLIDRLLASPRYGERYARHWLDVVRYADTDGFKSDVLRPDMYHYRDYVIRALNADKPYDRFLQEQLAGDELFAGDDDALTATGYLRLWPYEDNQADVKRQWKAILEDVTDITAEAMLGLGLKCAKCHDHKFDPILQKDYYNFQAFFASMVPREDLRLVGAVEMEGYQKQLDEWSLVTAPLRDEMAKLKHQPYKNQWASNRKKFPDYIHAVLDKPAEDRTPLENQYLHLTEHQIGSRAEKAFFGKLKTDAKKRWNAIEKEIADHAVQKPEALTKVLGVTDIGAVAPPTYVGGGESGEEAAPGYFAILNQPAARIEPIAGNAETTGRRAALARWMTGAENPLTSRVIVNRLWQWHFGEGIVETANDFGRQGAAPTHPELLDWLAGRLMEEGWSLKRMHRLMMTSATYQQASVVEASVVAQENDPENKLLWRMRVRRMDAEQIRDAILAVAGALDLEMGGAAVDDDEPRRTIYTLNKRNKLDTMVNTFDTPDLHNSCARRDVTTTPIQALALMNGDWTLEHATAFARSVRGQSADDEQRIELAYQAAFGRAPKAEERMAAAQFLKQNPVATGDPEQAFVDFCHVLLNANEFIYVD